MVKDDNSHEEGRNVGMDELQFDDIDSILSSEPENLSINLDPLESLVASSGEEYPSSFESDFVFHSEETTGSANFNIEDTLDLELTDPLVDAEIDKLLDINDISNISEISNLESDDSFFIPGDSAPDDGIDFSELDNSLTEEPDAFSFGEEDLEEFELSDQNEKSYQEEDFLSDEEGPIALSETELGEIAPAAEDDLPDFISTSVGSETEDEDSTLGEITGERSETFLDELEEEDAPISLSGNELDNILNTSSGVSDDDLPDFITHIEDEDFSLPVEQDSNLLSLDEISNSSLFEDSEEEKISLPEHELEGIGSPVLSEEDSLSFEDFELPTNDLEELENSTLEDEDANEPIALSDEELGNLLASENEEPAAMSEEPSDLPEAVDWDSPTSEPSEISLEEDEDANEPIALSDEELGNLLASENEEPAAMSEDEFGSNISEVEAEEDLSEILGELPPVSDLDAFDSIDEDVSKEEEVSKIVPTLESVKDQEMVIVLDEYADEEEPSPIEELRKTPDQTEAITGQLSGDVPSKDEMKRIMTYLDELLGNLPDDLIREFSRSDYFELYKKLMKQIGV
ncbi:hypothetical protein LEP1GSC059_1647 [Leptospira noguchii serovar Panama str. CZ214]|uniref:Uncharacterized protein n=2 Tax=Leptospira noguchii TaxID=28182 RepID=T0GW52_9LEPT|nr:hypothetical protein LEP1GSC059_1647 [Leptospira noguchii serovar Panama str. CZ214]